MRTATHNTEEPGMSESTEFDPTKGSEFEEFDVQAEPEAEADASIESLGAVADSEAQVQSLFAAREELEKLLMGPVVGASAVALSDDEPYNPANVVGVGIGEKVIGGVPTGQLAVKVLVKEKQPETRV